MLLIKLERHAGGGSAMSQKDSPPAGGQELCVALLVSYALPSPPAARRILSLPCLEGIF